MIHSTGPLTAKIMIVGEFAHEQDILRMSPLVGGFGFELSKMLNEAGIYREDCYVTLVNRGRAPQGRSEGLVAQRKKDITSGHALFNGRYVLASVTEGTRILADEIARVNPNVVIAMGNLALLALTGEWGVASWRSSIMDSTLAPGIKVIPTYSVAVLGGQWNLRSLIVHDLKRAKRQSAFPEIRRTPYNFLVRPTYEQARTALLTYISEAESAQARGAVMSVAGDIETRAGHVSCIAFARSSTEAFCIPIMRSTSPSGYWSADEEAELIHLIYRLCSITRVIGQNWNYDAQYIFRHWHFLCPQTVDTMIQQHSCFSNLDKNLSFLSSMYLEDHLHWKDDRTNWTEGPKGEGEDKYWIYNCTDAVRTFAINEVLDKVVEGMKLEEINTFQQHLTTLVLKAMIRGVRMDNSKRAAFSMQLQAEVATREEWIATVVGRPINIKSPKQMAHFFYTEMGLTPIIDKKTKGITTNDEALHRIAEREPILAPITRKIAELRSLGVFHSTFVCAPLDFDGRIRTNFNVAGTNTYRFASSKNAFGGGCNFQNIPKGGDTEDDGLELPNVRQLFVPDFGHTMFDIDLDSADLRIVTWESDCAWMKDHFRNGRKPYVEVMREYYKNRTMTKTSHPREYAMFKSLCHGTNYLGTAQGIAPRIGLLVKETEAIQKWYYEMCPEILKWQDNIKKQVEKRRCIENVFGYRYHFFGRIEGNIFNEAVAWIPQSTVACLINRAWAAIDKNLPEVEVLIQVHDSLVGQFESHHGDWALRRIVEESQVPLPYPEPLVIPVGIASSSVSWGDCR